MSGRREENLATTARRIGTFAGPAALVAVLLFPEPGSLSPAGWRTAGVAAWMSIWWMTEVVSISATALLPLVLFPALGVLSMADTSAPYANDLIFLFMGGFFLGAAMEATGLHRRIGLSIVKSVGTSPDRLVLGFMLATAAVSMWISNTATAAMMLPISIAVSELMRRPDEKGGIPAVGVPLMLGLAYGASIGGVATLIGTPPNAVLAGAASELLGFEIGFAQWLIVGLPVTAVMLPVTWVLLVKVLHPIDNERYVDVSSVLDREVENLGPISSAERRVAWIFALTAAAWLLRSPKDLGAFWLPGIQTWMPEVRDSTIAIAASLALFLVARGRDDRSPILDWPRARKIPWGVLVLLGGGLSLARAMDRSGFAAWIGNGIASLADAPEVVLFLAIATLFVFLTEVSSNTATSTMAMPVLVGVGAALGMAPLPLMITAALAASMAFMLPAATPPNAIVFGSDYLTIPQMVRAGIVLNFIAIGLITLAALALIPFAFAAAP